MFVSMTAPSSSVLLPGSMPRRRTWPTPSAKRRFAGMTRYVSAPTRAASTSQCLAIEKPCGTLSVVHRRNADPVVSASVERMTMWPENGSSFHMKSNAASSWSAGTRHATSAPGARFVAMSVWRMRRIVLRGQHRAQPLVHGGDVELGESRDLDEWIDQETRDTVLGDGKDPRVDRVGDFGGNGCDAHPPKLAGGTIDYAAVDAGVGSHTVNREPSPRMLSTVMSPPIICARFRLIVRPSPVPPCERV